MDCVSPLCWAQRVFFYPPFCCSLSIDADQLSSCMLLCYFCTIVVRHHHIHSSAPPHLASIPASAGCTLRIFRFMVAPDQGGWALMPAGAPCPTGAPGPGHHDLRPGDCFSLQLVPTHVPNYKVVADLGAMMTAALLTRSCLSMSPDRDVPNQPSRYVVGRRSYCKYAMLRRTEEADQPGSVAGRSPLSRCGSHRDCANKVLCGF